MEMKPKISVYGEDDLNEFLNDLYLLIWIFLSINFALLFCIVGIIVVFII